MKKKVEYIAIWFLVTLLIAIFIFIPPLFISFRNPGYGSCYTQPDDNEVILDLLHSKKGGEYVIGLTYLPYINNTYPVISTLAPIVQGNRPSFSIFIAKFKSTNSLAWSRVISFDDYAFYLGSLEDNDGNFYIYGKNTINNFPIMNVSHPLYDTSSKDLSSIFIVKFSGGGQILYSISIPIDVDSVNIQVNDNGELFLASYGLILTDFPNSTPKEGIIDKESFLLKFDNSGIPIFKTILPYAQRVDDLLIVSSNAFVMIQSNVPFDFNNKTIPAGENVFEINSSGSITDVKSYGYIGGKSFEGLFSIDNNSYSIIFGDSEKLVVISPNNTKTISLFSEYPDNFKAYKRGNKLIITGELPASNLPWGHMTQVPLNINTSLYFVTSLSGNLDFISGYIFENPFVSPFNADFSQSSLYLVGLARINEPLIDENSFSSSILGEKDPMLISISGTSYSATFYPVYPGVLMICP